MKNEKGDEPLDQTIIMGLVYNAALLITLALIYIAVYNKPRVPSWGNDLMVGLVGGLSGVLIMYTAVGLSYGAYRRRILGFEVF